MKTFVTGLHRAGTHSIAEHMAADMGLPYIEESVIGLDSLAIVDKLIKEYKDGFVCQCPFLAHKVLELAKRGEVYWCKRNKLDVVTSMRNGSFDTFSWKVMVNFHDEFPDDPIWWTLKYDGSKDVYSGFVNHFALLLRVKEYFLQNYFKDYVKVMQLEKQPYYNAQTSLSHNKRLKPAEAKGLIL